MKKQELIKKYEDLFEKLYVFPIVTINGVVEDLKQLDEPQLIKFKDVITRIKGFDSGTQKVWLDEILNELGSDYGTLKYKAGYEQGKFDGTMEREKVVVPQFVADWIEYCKKYNFTLFGCLDPEDGFESLANETFEGDARKCIRWCRRESNIFSRAWLDGYTVEKEPKYTVKVKATKQYLSNDEIGPHFDPSFRSNFTKSDLEKLGLGWVFDCEGMEVEKVGK